jgi:hypothetical protein
MERSSTRIVCAIVSRDGVALSATALHTSLIDALDRFTDGGAVRDDIPALVLEYPSSTPNRLLRARLSYEPRPWDVLTRGDLFVRQADQLLAAAARLDVMSRSVPPKAQPRA